MAHPLAGLARALLAIAPARTAAQGGERPAGEAGMRRRIIDELRGGPNIVEEVQDTPLRLARGAGLIDEGTYRAHREDLPGPLAPLAFAETMGRTVVADFLDRPVDAAVEYSGAGPVTRLFHNDEFDNAPPALQAFAAPGRFATQGLRDRVRGSEYLYADIMGDGDYSGLDRALDTVGAAGLVPIAKGGSVAGRAGGRMVADGLPDGVRRAMAERPQLSGDELGATLRDAGEHLGSSWQNLRSIGGDFADAFGSRPYREAQMQAGFRAQEEALIRALDPAIPKPTTATTNTQLMSPSSYTRAGDGVLEFDLRRLPTRGRAPHVVMGSDIVPNPTAEELRVARELLIGQGNPRPSNLEVLELADALNEPARERAAIEFLQARGVPNPTSQQAGQAQWAARRGNEVELFGRVQRAVDKPFSPEAFRERRALLMRLQRPETYMTGTRGPRASEELAARLAVTREEQELMDRALGTFRRDRQLMQGDEVVGGFGRAAMLGGAGLGLAATFGALDGDVPAPSQPLNRPTRSESRRDMSAANIDLMVSDGVLTPSQGEALARFTQERRAARAASPGDQNALTGLAAQALGIDGRADVETALMGLVRDPGRRTFSTGEPSYAFDRVEDMTADKLRALPRTDRELRTVYDNPDLPMMRSALDRLSAYYDTGRGSTAPIALGAAEASLAGERAGLPFSLAPGDRSAPVGKPATASEGVGERNPITPEDDATVASLQSQLNRVLGPGRQIAVDNQLGQETRAAVSEVERLTGEDLDVSPAGLQRTKALLDRTPLLYDAEMAGNENPYIGEIQMFLIELGIPPGDLDRLRGPKTLAALNEGRKRLGLRELDAEEMPAQDDLNAWRSLYEELIQAPS